MSGSIQEFGSSTFNYFQAFSVCFFFFHFVLFKGKNEEIRDNRSNLLINELR